VAILDGFNLEEDIEDNNDTDNVEDLMGTEYLNEFQEDIDEEL